MNKVGKLALFASATMLAVAPVVAQAADTRPSAEFFAAPSQLKSNGTSNIAPLAGSNMRAGLRTGKQSKLFGGSFFLAFFTAIAGYFGYSSIDSFIAALRNGTFTGQPASPGTFG